MELKGHIKHVNLTSEGLSSVHVALDGMPMVILSMGCEQAAEMAPLVGGEITLRIDAVAPVASSDGSLT